MNFQFAETKSGWIPTALLHQGGLYIIDARNAYLGVWNTSTSGFQIARVRYIPWLLKGRMSWENHGTYLFEEKHQDTGEPHGTAKPLVFLEHVPPSEAGDLLAYLLKASQRFPKKIAQDLVSKRIPDPV